ncbi:MAG TPA: shikimate kinase [Pyrinomonadaceae bacterium]|nr:shikimate kinase [Pyrinomonadaceae bacterium]
MSDVRLALTGFMGVGKSSVARHLAHLLKVHRVDLDTAIENSEGRTITRIIDQDGVERYREIETENLRSVVAANDVGILSLGGGAWTVDLNRHILKEHNFTTLWLESSFEHCWLNISFSHKDRPLARDKAAAEALFNERQKLYCLADWHFIVRPGSTSYDVAKEIVEELF